jgi:hypothetical protein
MAPTSCAATSLGVIARQAFTQAQQATVWGVTSSGIFLRLSSGWIVFLSFDQFKGPLTLNSPFGPDVFQTLQPGLTVDFCSNKLNFASLELEVYLDHAEVWSAPTRTTPLPAEFAGRFDRLNYINRKVLAARESLIYVHLSSDPFDAASPDSLKLSSLLEKYLGLGQGLTPSGDDVVLGYLLSINRWGDLLNPDLDVPEINRELHQAAYRKTSLLSANLIECATHGQADERLVLALDGILTGDPDPDVCVAQLLSWGHTSGASALIGMTLAITGQFPKVWPIKP